MGRGRPIVTIEEGPEGMLVIYTKVKTFAVGREFLEEACKTCSSPGEFVRFLRKRAGEKSPQGGVTVDADQSGELLREYDAACVWERIERWCRDKQLDE